MATPIIATMTVRDTVTGQTDTQTVTFFQSQAPVISSFTVSPQTAPANTSRHFVVSATGDNALSYTLSIPGKADVVNNTGIFDVVV